MRIIMLTARALKHSLSSLWVMRFRNIEPLTQATRHCSDVQTCIDAVAQLRWTNGKPVCVRSRDRKPHERIRVWAGQAIDNFWSCLRRTLSGTYVAVDPMHMDRHFDEQMFLLNNRIGHTDGTRLTKALAQVTGRRLTWVELTGKELAQGA